MTRLSSPLGVAICAFLLAACGGSQEAPASETTVASPSPAVATPASAPETPAPTAAPVETQASPEFAALPAPFVDADYARGKRVWRQCSSCHTVAAEADHLVGPNLHGLFGRQVGSAEGFNYSTAVQEADFVWTPEKLEEWLTSPRNFLPGNRMSFAGVRKPQDRVNVIAYLMVESGWVAE